MSIFSDRLNQAIAMSGLTQREVAEEAQTTETTISRYCHGKREPSAYMIVNLCAVFNCSADWLLGRE